VEVLLDTRVTAIADDHVVLQSADHREKLETYTVVWAAGVAASGLASAMGEATGAPIDRAGRIRVDDFLNVAGHKNIFVIGDAALSLDQDSAPLPGLAPVAMQQGEYAARAIRDQMKNREPQRPFTYRNRGNMAVIGRFHAIAVVGKRHLSGFPAWLFWGLIHLREISQFQNRMLVMFQWAWTFFTRRRFARLITSGYSQPNDRSAGSTATDGAPETGEHSPDRR
jgi:NADH dehydrogenase